MYILELSIVFILVTIVALLSPKLVHKFCKPKTDDLVHCKLSDGFVQFTTPESYQWAQENPELVQSLFRSVNGHQFDRI